MLLEVTFKMCMEATQNHSSKHFMGEAYVQLWTFLQADVYDEVHIRVTHYDYIIGAVVSTVHNIKVYNVNSFM